MSRNLWSTAVLLSLAAIVAAGSPLSADDLGAPVSVAILFQEDVTAGVQTDLEPYRDFILGLPEGSSVMLGYARVGALQIPQALSTDLKSAADSVRAPAGIPSMAPGSPFQSLKEFIKKFADEPSDHPRFVIFVSDGLDRYGPLESSPSNSPVLKGAINAAKKADIRVFGIYAPTQATRNPGSYLSRQGQASLNYLSEQTKGRAYFGGGTYITARPFLEEIRKEITF